MSVPAPDATVLLHQFSEWLDRPKPHTADLTHDDLVELFLQERSPAAWPVVEASPSPAVSQ